MDIQLNCFQNEIIYPSDLLAYLVHKEKIIFPPVSRSERCCVFLLNGSFIE